MRRLSQIILFLGLAVYLQGQSPHGEDFTLSCDDCHTSEGWKLLAGTYAFDHNSTSFPLEGLHQSVNCKSCHTSLVFSEANTDCMSCHADMHNQTVGFECSRCHTPRSWIVENITEVHQLSRFPLLGPHAMADCYDCHASVSLLEFQPMGIECLDCHQEEYMATTQPNHTLSGFSTDCSDCHSMNSFAWVSSGFNHDFFPLNEGHAVNDCSQCHKDGDDYSSASPECYTCHLSDYSSTTNPNHYTANISNTCDECHTTQPGWKPAEFELHDAQYFPVYSGSHNGEWISCAECHTNSSSYAVFTCIDCHDHNQPDMDDEHEGIGGYFYNSQACFECHPTGEEEGSFNHNASNFPLTGAHTTTDCSECHTQGYPGTPTVCFECHSEQFNQSTNPNHLIAELSTACDLCHSTAPDWIPATFDVHNDYYALTGAHATIANDCYDCHAGDYIETPNECAGCHTPAFNETTNPNHVTIGLSNDCAACHSTQPEWKPAGFPVHNEYYLLEGAHAIVAEDCYSCHAGNYSTTPNTCYACHTQEYNETTDPSHQVAQFPTECEACHSQTAWEPATFDHDGQYFPIYSGEHEGEWDQCSDCHDNPANYALFTCITCHTQGETDDDHSEVQGYAYNSQACLECHPTGDVAGSFNHAASNFPLTGAHLTTDCMGCHSEGYSGTPTQCFACHADNFNQSTNPDHNGVGISNDCESCHSTQPGWEPATFPVHNEYYALTGAHATIANNCSDCHAGDYNNTPNACAGCHTSQYDQTTNPNHNGIGIPNSCEDCHTTQPEWKPAEFAIHNEYYLLTGAHAVIASDCYSCHAGNYNTTPSTCYACHTAEYNQTNDPPHLSAQFPTDCETCHTQSAWEPSTFEHDGQYFPIYSGKHQGEWDQCSDCHNNPGNYAVFTCLTCHTQGETDNDHDEVSGYVYESNACLACHPDGDDGSNKQFKVR